MIHYVEWDGLRRKVCLEIALICIWFNLNHKHTTMCTHRHARFIDMHQLKATSDKDKELCPAFDVIISRSDLATEPFNKNPRAGEATRSVHMPPWNTCPIFLSKIKRCLNCTLHTRRSHLNWPVNCELNFSETRNQNEMNSSITCLAGWW